MILESPLAITSDLHLQRLLQVIDTVESVALVGFAQRGLDGAWDYTCQQLHLKNAYLEIQEGYLYSSFGCMFCDVTSSSFLAATWILQKLSFDPFLPRPSQEIDWALRLQRWGVLSVTCPDIMLHTSKLVLPIKPFAPDLNNPCVTADDRRRARTIHLQVKRLYRRLAQKWELTTVRLSNNTFLEYNCREIHFECKAQSRVRHYMLPPCCLTMKNRMLKTIHGIAREAQIPYQINTGTLLGAIKFKDAIPWDFDDDAFFRNNDNDIFKRNKQRMRRLGLSPAFKHIFNKSGSIRRRNYMDMNGQGGFVLDLWGVDPLPTLASEAKLQKLPNNLVCFVNGHFQITIKDFLNRDKKNENNNEDVKNSNYINSLIDNNHYKDISPFDFYKHKYNDTHIITKSENFDPKDLKSSNCYLQSLVKVGNNWLPAPWNPGLAARKSYGDELLRHRPHWRLSGGNKRSNMWSGLGQEWPKCPTPGSSLCLDIHPLDGSVPFM